MVIKVSINLTNIVIIAKSKTVPVIAVLTKYEALVDRLKLESKGRKVTKNEVLNYLDKEVMMPLKAAKNKPSAIVQTHCKLFINCNNKSNNIEAF